MKMKTRLFPPSSTLRMSLILLAVFVASCAPASATEPPVLAPVESSATPIPPSEPTFGTDSESTPSVDLTATYTLELLSATPPVDAQPIATSRGPNLEATDPTTVNLSSGQIQFVEFFRFT